MRLLSLDISTNTGWAVFEDGTLIEHGLIQCKDPEISYVAFSETSLSAMLRVVETFASRVEALIDFFEIDAVIIEQTNLAVKGSRYVQKLLEWLHYTVIQMILRKLGRLP